MKNLILITFIIFLISCNNDEKTNAIIQENKELKQKIADLQKQTTSCKFYALPTTEKYHFKRGEKGIYTISLALFDDIEKTIVILANPNTNKYQDTFTMDNGYSLKLPFNTNESGEHIISGKVQRLSGGVKQNEYFEITYVVE